MHACYTDTIRRPFGRLPGLFSPDRQGRPFGRPCLQNRPCGRPCTDVYTYIYIYIYYACMLYRHNTPTFRPAARTFQPRQAGSTLRPTLPAEPTLRPTLHGFSDAVPLLQGEILIRCTILTAVEKIESCTCTCKKYVI